MLHVIVLVVNLAILVNGAVIDTVFITSNPKGTILCLAETRHFLDDVALGLVELIL